LGASNLEENECKGENRDIPDIGFPPSTEIPGLTVNQTTVDEFLNWSSFDRSWPHGGYEADVEREDGEGSNKENEWIAVPVDE